jgi:hypothetical protein
MINILEYNKATCKKSKETNVIENLKYFTAKNMIKYLDILVRNIIKQKHIII